jgi:hypothetical protein
VAWTPEALIPSKDMEAFVQVDVNPEDSEEIECKLKSCKNKHISRASLLKYM